MSDQAYVKTLKNSELDIIYPQSTAEIVGRQSDTTKTVESSLYLIETQLGSTASESYVDQSVAAIVGASPEGLRTLRDLANSLGNDTNFVATFTNLLGSKEDIANLHTAAYKDVESTGILSNNGNLPTVAQVKAYVDNKAGITDIIINGTEQSKVNNVATLDLSDFLKASSAGEEVQNPNPVNAYTLGGYTYGQVISNARTAINSSTDDENLYIVGYNATEHEYNYNSSVYFNPSTGTLSATTIQNAGSNDYAEWFEKSNINDQFTPGEVCVWSNNGIIKSNKQNDKTVIGVVSNTYGHILGGENLSNINDNNKKYVPIGLKGRVNVFVVGAVEAGDLIVSAENGCGIVNNNASINQVIGKALETNINTNKKLIKMLII